MSYWIIGVDDNGILGTTASASGPSSLFVLGDSGGQGTFWQTTTDANGIIKSTGILYPGAYSTQVTLVSPGGYSFYLTIDANGILYTSFTPNFSQNLMLTDAMNARSKGLRINGPDIVAGVYMKKCSAQSIGYGKWTQIHDMAQLSQDYAKLIANGYLSDAN